MLCLRHAETVRSRVLLHHKLCACRFVCDAGVQITKKHDKTVARLLKICALPRVRTNLVHTFMSKVDTQPFLRILNNERYEPACVAGAGAVFSRLPD